MTEPVTEPVSVAEAVAVSRGSSFVRVHFGPRASRNTLKQHFRGRVAQGRLSQLGGGRGVWYKLS